MLRVCQPFQLVPIPGAVGEFFTRSGEWGKLRFCVGSEPDARELLQKHTSRIRKNHPQLLNRPPMANTDRIPSFDKGLLSVFVGERLNAFNRIPGGA